MCSALAATSCATHRTTQTQTELRSSGKTFDQALDVFLQAEHAVLRKMGKTPMVKADVILNHNITLGNDTIAIGWKTSADAPSIATRNFRFIHQPSDYFYLDCGAGGWEGNYPSGWCDPFKTWQRLNFFLSQSLRYGTMIVYIPLKAYIFSSLENLTSSQVALRLGGQQLLWTEQSGPENLDPITWPRAAGSAEVFWTGATLPDGIPRNYTSALERLHDIRYRMVQRGLQAIGLQPHWGALRPGLCDLGS